jgi:hypothetical protein
MGWLGCISATSIGAFDLLSAIGRDCVGALQLLPEGQEPTGIGPIEGVEVDESATAPEGLRLGVDHALTSCGCDPGEDGRPCGAGDSCLLRAKGFAEAGVADPLYLRFGMAAMPPTKTRRP